MHLINSLSPSDATYAVIYLCQPGSRSPVGHQAITWTSAYILSVEYLGANSNEI